MVAELPSMLAVPRGAIARLNAAGYEAFAVGGCVRDTLLGLTPKDWDITTAALPQVGWITADSLRVRGGAGMQYDIIGGLAQGDRVEITGKSGDWYAIRFGETETGYVSGQYLTFEDPATAATTASEK